MRPPRGLEASLQKLTIEGFLRQLGHPHRRCWTAYVRMSPPKFLVKRTVPVSVYQGSCTSAVRPVDKRPIESSNLSLVLQHTPDESETILHAMGPLRKRLFN